MEDTVYNSNNIVNGNSPLACALELLEIVL